MGDSIHSGTVGRYQWQPAKKRGNPLRLYVIGAPGSGKSHVCQTISDALGIPWFDLNDDDMDSLSGDSYLDTKRRLLALPDWIFEAVFETGVWNEALAAADLVVVIATPWPIRVFRVMRRFFHRTFRHENFRGQDSDETVCHMMRRAHTTFLYECRLWPVIQGKLTGAAGKTVFVKNNLELLYMPIIIANQEAGQE